MPIRGAWETTDQGIGGDERTLIKRVQPYNAPNPPDMDPLAVLNRLSNLDKHRLLVPVIAAINMTKVWITSDNANVNFTFIELGPVKHDAQIVAFTARPTDPSKDMHVNPQSGLQVQLSDTGIDRNVSLDDLLTVLHHHVRHTIIDGWFKWRIMPPAKPTG